MVGAGPTKALSGFQDPSDEMHRWLDGAVHSPHTAHGSLLGDVLTSGCLLAAERLLDPGPSPYYSAAKVPGVASHQPEKLRHPPNLHRNICVALRRSPMHLDCQASETA